MPPPAEGFAARLVLGPALRTQPDRRLVALVREGYESAFEEIVRRYGKPLTRYAAAIVGSRGEDVTQDAFSKALLALRRDGAEIELRPWLFRIVRNTALNELRDNPPSPEVLAEAIAGGRNPAEEIERREELTDLMQRLQSLPEPQRAAIVMRELEGLGHEEIAAALGLSGGGARQAIYRARQALREGAGMLLPLPLLRLLIDHGSDATAAAAGAGGAAAASGAMGGAGAGIALKAGVVTAVLAGSVGTGIALHDRGHDADAAAATTPNAVTRALSDTAPTTAAESPKPQSLAEHYDEDRSSHGDSGNGNSDDSGHGPDGDRHDQLTSGQSLASDDDGPDPSLEVGGHHGQRGPDEGDEPHGGRGEDGGSSHSGSGGGSGGGGPSEPRGGGEGGSGGGGSGSSGSGRGRDDSGGGDSGSAEPAPPPPPPEESGPDDDGGSGSNSGSNSSGSGSGSGPSDDGRHGGEEIP